MVPESLRRSRTASDGVAPREYGTVLLLLLASALLQSLATASVEAIAAWAPTAFGPQAVGAVVYATLGFAALAAAFLVWRDRTPPSEQTEGHDLLTLAGATAAFLLVGAYALHRVADLPTFPGGVITALLRGGLAMGLLAVAYASARGIDLRTALPDSDESPVVTGTVAASTLAALAWLATFVYWVDLGPVVATAGDGSAAVAFGGPARPQLSIGTLVWDVAAPAGLVGAGTAALYNGAVQEVLRDRAGPAGAVAAVTALAAVNSASVGISRSPDAVTTIATAAAVVVLSVVIAAVAVEASRLLGRSLGTEPSLFTAGLIGVGAAVLPVLGTVAAGLAPVSALLAGGSLAAVGAVACVGYERTRSIWVPALAFATYLFLTNGELAMYVVRVFG